MSGPPSPEPPLSLRLTADATQQWTLDGSRFVVGHREPADILLNDPRVSDVHARIEKRRDAWWIVDLDSETGTFLDGERVREHPLTSGGRLSIGGVELVLDASSPETTPDPIDIDGTEPLSITPPATTLEMAAPGAAVGVEGLKGKGWTQSGSGGTGPADDGKQESASSSPRGAIEGDVRGFRERTEQGWLKGRSRVIWTFRVEHYDDRGNRLRSVPVTMQGSSIRGQLGEGNRVRVLERRRRSGDVRATKVQNLTTDSVVIARRFGLMLVPVLALSLLLVGGVAYGIGRVTKALGNSGPPTVAPVGAASGPGGQPSGGVVVRPSGGGTANTGGGASAEPSTAAVPASTITCTADACEVTGPGGDAVTNEDQVEWVNHTGQQLNLNLYDELGESVDLAELLPEGSLDPRDEAGSIPNDGSVVLQRSKPRHPVRYSVDWSQYKFCGTLWADVDPTPTKAACAGSGGPATGGPTPVPTAAVPFPTSATT